VIALGTPASDLGPSDYRTSSGSVLLFDSATASGASCRSAGVALTSVSLFGGVVTASSVQATDGKGVAADLQIDGSAVTATAGQTVPVDGWGQLTLGARVGRVTSPLVLRLLRARDGLPAGTAVAVAFAASRRAVARHPRATSRERQASVRSRSGNRSAGTRRVAKHERRPRKPPPNYPETPSPFTAGGELTDAARDNPVVAIALRYLGVRYQWGGASPKTGFDCSGLVTYVFGQLGVPLVHYAAAQWHAPDSVWVAPNQLQPGDLVFFTGADGTRKAPGHVGIYVDDGYIIDAPHTGSFVRIDSLDDPTLAAEYVGARHIRGAAIDARHLLRVSNPGGPTADMPVGFPTLTLASVGAPLGIAVARAAAVPSTSSGFWIRVGPALGGLLLTLVAGGFLISRRPPRIAPSGDS
jgi:cell wall-associated NlpC family hydrolase